MPQRLSGRSGATLLFTALSVGLASACDGSQEVEPPFEAVPPEAPKTLWVSLPAETLNHALSTGAVSPERLALLRGGKGFKALEPGPWQHPSDVVAVPVTESEITKLGELVHGLYRKCGGFIAHESEAAAREALEPQEVSSDVVADLVIDQQAVAEPWIAEVSEAEILATIEKLSSFRNRFHGTEHGRAAALWLRDRWTELAGGRSDVKVDLFTHAFTNQPSVVMTITGRSAPHEIVVLGGHLDSITGGGGDTVAPGADDDASGVAALTEVIRTAMKLGVAPGRTLKFMGYAAEEVGLRGSQDIARTFKMANEKVVGVMQLDMVGYAGSGKKIAFIEDYTDPTLTAFTKKLVETYVKVPWVSTACGYACSDHASWNSRSYPSVFPVESTFEESNGRIHTRDDTIATFGGNATHAALFVRLAAAFAAEMAEAQTGAPSVMPGPGGSGGDGGTSGAGGASGGPDGRPSGEGGASGQVAQGGASGDPGTGGRSSTDNQAGAGGSPPRGGNTPPDERPSPNEGAGGGGGVPGQEPDDDEAVSGGCRYGQGGAGSGGAGQALGLTALALLFGRRAQRRPSRRNV